VLSFGFLDPPEQVCVWLCVCVVCAWAVRGGGGSWCTLRALLLCGVCCAQVPVPPNAFTHARCHVRFHANLVIHRRRCVRHCASCMCWMRWTMTGTSHPWVTRWRGCRSSQGLHARWWRRTAWGE
jgi:hypothetical protein